MAFDSGLAIAVLLIGGGLIGFGFKVSADGKRFRREQREDLREVTALIRAEFFGNYADKVVAVAKELAGLGSLTPQVLSEKLAEEQFRREGLRQSEGLLEAARLESMVDGVVKKWRVIGELLFPLAGVVVLAGAIVLGIFPPGDWGSLSGADQSLLVGILAVLGTLFTCSFAAIVLLWVRANIQEDRLIEAVSAKSKTLLR